MADFEIDFERSGRVGFPEVIFGESKSPEILVKILQAYNEKNQNALITKLQSHKIDHLLAAFPDAITDKESGIFLLNLQEAQLITGEVAIIAAGTSDIFIVNEIYYTLAYLGRKAEIINDVGVSGVHRLLKKVEHLKQFKILIVVAGFEGALPTVVGGVLPQPVIAVPTSIGYGVATGGHAALNTMLSSCANGITVVNINNGYGAAMSAFRILNMNNQ